MPLFQITTHSVTLTWRWWITSSVHNLHHPSHLAIPGRSSPKYRMSYNIVSTAGHSTEYCLLLLLDCSYIWLRGSHPAGALASTIARVQNTIPKRLRRQSNCKQCLLRTKSPQGYWKRQQRPVQHWPNTTFLCAWRTTISMIRQFLGMIKSKQALIMEMRILDNWS
jgi:hypothetical protein